MALNGLSSSDWHLGSLKTIFPDHLQKQFHEINKVYRYAVENGVEHLFVPGDISNTPIMGDDVLMPLLKLLLTYDEYVHTYYIGGNHDFESTRKTSLDVLKFLCDEGLFKNFHIYDSPQCLKIDGVYVNMMPFPSTVLPESVKPTLNFVHIDMDGAVSDNGTPLKVKDRPNLGDNSVTISGHVHQYQMLKKDRFLYNGNPYQRKFNESLPKGFVHFQAGTAKGKMRLRHQFVNNRPEFELRTLRVQSSDDFDRIDPSAHIKYSLKIDEGVRVPADLTTRYTNIHSQSRGSSLAEVTQQLIDNQEQRSLDLTEGLLTFLKGLSLEKARRKEALGMVREALVELGLS